MLFILDVFSGLTAWHLTILRGKQLLEKKILIPAFIIYIDYYYYSAFYYYYLNSFQYCNWENVFGAKCSLYFFGEKQLGSVRATSLGEARRGRRRVEDQEAHTEEEEQQEEEEELLKLEEL